jgi:hypothetical protein
VALLGWPEGWKVGAAAVTSTVRASSTTATYELVVAGELGPTIVERLQGFDAIRVEDGRTQLVGRVGNQTRLYDVLEVLHEFAIPVVSLHPVVDPPAA